MLKRCHVLLMSCAFILSLSALASAEVGSGQGGNESLTSERLDARDCNHNLLATQYAKDTDGTFGMNSPFNSCASALPSDAKLNQTSEFNAALNRTFPAAQTAVAAGNAAPNCPIKSSKLKDDDLQIANQLAQAERASSIDRLQRGTEELMSELNWLSAMVNEGNTGQHFHCMVLSVAKNQCESGKKPDCSDQGKAIFDQLAGTVAARWERLQIIKKEMESIEDQPNRSRNHKKLAALKAEKEMIEKLTPWLNQEVFQNSIKKKSNDVAAALKEQMAYNMNQISKRIKEYDEVGRCLLNRSSEQCKDYQKVMQTAPPIGYLNKTSSSGLSARESLYLNGYLKAVECLQFQRDKKEAVNDLYTETALSAALPLVPGGFVALGRLASASKALRAGSSVWRSSKAGQYLAKGGSAAKTKLAVLGLDGATAFNALAGGAQSMATCDGTLRKLERLNLEQNSAMSCRDRRSYFNLKTEYEDCVIAVVAGTVVNTRGRPGEIVKVVDGLAEAKGPAMKASEVAFESLQKAKSAASSGNVDDMVRSYKKAAESTRETYKLNRTDALDRPLSHFDEVAHRIAGGDTSVYDDMSNTLLEAAKVKAKESNTEVSKVYADLVSRESKTMAGEANRLISSTENSMDHRAYEAWKLMRARVDMYSFHWREKANLMGEEAAEAAMDRAEKELESFVNKNGLKKAVERWEQAENKILNY